jgi:pyrroline-5-carboxylate reductase
MKTGRICIIGGGNMGGAILHGLMRGDTDHGSILLVEIEPQIRQSFQEIYGVATAPSLDREISGDDAVILAVKPQDIEEVLANLKPLVKPATLVLSVAAGIPTSYIEKRLAPRHPVARTMPNIAAKIGASAVAICFNRYVKKDQKDLASSIVSGVGLVVEVDEGKMDAVTGLSGSGPAFVFMMIEALAEGGVLLGLSRDTALSLAAQTVLGAASMVTETGEHPAILRERVTSPGGTTAEGLHTLERGGFRHLISAAVRSAAEKSALLGEKYGDIS